MRDTCKIPIIDLHCDTLTELHKHGIGLQNDRLCFSLHRLPEPYRLCQVFAIFMPDEYRGEEAEAYFETLYALFERQMLEYRDNISRVMDVARIDQALAEKRFAAVLAVEGGSMLAGKLERLDMLAERGVKLITLTWNAENEICGGADTSKGFTPFGRNVVRRMERLGLAVDVSHLSDRGFWELCELAEKPFLASHSNARSVCPHRRNLTDDMFREIARRGGVVGLNYHVGFITESGNSTSMQDLLRHVHRFLELGGEQTLALGSDFDGADMPPYLADIGGIGGLAEGMLRSGISNTTVQNILYENARRFFTGLAGGETP